MKRGFIIVITVVSIGLIWYFLIKPQDYQVRVIAKTNIGVINQTLKAWNQSLTNATIQQIDNLENLKQTIHLTDSTHIYNWRISSITDSTSQLIVDVKDPDHSFQNKFFIPFTDTNFEKKARKTVIDFIENLNDHLKDFKVNFIGEEKLPATYCACVTHKTVQSKKAFAMMESYPFLNSVITNNSIQLNGVPFIETSHWNMQNDSIAFNFCYPIIKTDSLPIIKNLIYKDFTGRRSLKAIYNGNYMTSDRAWYTLLNYAKKNNIEVDKKPIEFFFNNPNMGGDALRWNAEIFMPIIE
ncbi:transcriptional regulator [Maribacter hydrothermalis]|uniref:Transcriptional regulator n=1 Tax=Maribacter hydrothermalis TaxID=1836467 RepID=A0A1B7Z3F3_9FLAO|nr:transcriptional regulator [Maribacter hydrothermalis]APQ16957.1 transcriptional regulator [Maribacter hydrothermalis]OBR37218.1 transcriptional regulator [Maribacter hydrothermalis]